MPDKPGKNQSREEYMRSCVTKLKSEGESGAKAREICFAVWMGNKRKGKK